MIELKALGPLSQTETINGVSVFYKLAESNPVLPPVQVVPLAMQDQASREKKTGRNEPYQQEVQMAGNSDGR